MNSINDILTQKADQMFVLETDILTTSITPMLDESKEEKSEVDIEKIRKIAYSLRDQINNLIQNLDNTVEIKNKVDTSTNYSENNEEKIIEGVFNGLQMIGSDGNEYSVPPNYASKSKLVEGDMMKLTIKKNGAFLFKQILPINRKRITGKLMINEENKQWSVMVEEKKYKVLTASITFYRGRPGDNVVIIVPADSTSEWGAVENIIH